ncbi:MAG: hypothetical protein ACREMR_05340 [Gemmatimonadales bacterium]
MSPRDGRLSVVREPEPRSLRELEGQLVEISAELREAAELIAGHRRGIAEAARHIARYALYPVPGGPDAIGLARDLAAMVDIAEEVEGLLPFWAKGGTPAEE